MSSLLAKIKADKAAKLAAGIRPESDKIGIEDVNLRGTGLTKREAEKNTRAYEREMQKSVKADKSDFIDEAETEFDNAVQRTIEAMREANLKEDIKYDNSQLAAIAGILHNRVSVLIGAAGTGKTTVTKKIVSELVKNLANVKVAQVTFVCAKPKNSDKEIRIRLSDAIKQDMIVSPKDMRLIEEEMPAIAFAAYTGRATQQLKRALPEQWHKNCSTIHALLGYAPTFEEYEEYGELKTRRVFRPTFDRFTKLPFMYVVLDEASMIPIPLFNELIDALPENARILLIGDIHQLPPVYGKSVLGYAMRKWPVFELTTIHRQAAGNAIISNAHKTLNGKMLSEASNFKLIGNAGKSPSPGGMSELQKYFLKVIKQLNEMKRYDPYADTIIVPGRVAENGNLVSSDALNQYLVTMFNPEVKEHGVIVNKRIQIHTGTGHVHFAIRDKVMIISNINTVEPPITNGMVGIIESININGKYDMKRSQIDFESEDDEPEPMDLDLNNLKFALGDTADDAKEKDKDDETSDQRQSSHILTIKFENGQSYSCSTAGDYRRITHGYAATCHKSQGGEYPNIIILCHSVNARMLSQEWLYTAITRARNNVYLVCNERGLTQALTRQNIKGYTLAEKIKSYIIETKADDEMGFDTMKFPILWEPCEV